MRARLSIAALLVVLVFAVFGRVREHEFVSYDDPIYILENPSLHLGLGSESLRLAFEPYETNWIPLTWISLQIDHALYGMEPAGYLLTNVGLHAATALLLFLVLAQMTGAVWRSAFVAAIFAVHPLHVESVAWASERKDALSGLFFALSLAAWAHYAERPGAFRYLTVVLALALGLMAKPTLVTLPFVLLLLDYWPLGRLRSEAPRAFPDAPRLWRALVEKLPLLALVTAAGAVTFAVQRATGAMSGEDVLPFGARLANALESTVVYLVKSVWPSGLAVFYPHPGEALPAWRAAGAAALLGAITAAAGRAAAARPYLLMGWLWYLGMLLPMSGIVQVGLQARADRYTYLPMIGLSVAVAWGAADALARWRHGRLALATAGSTAVAALAVAAWAQVGYWSNTIALFERAAAMTRDNYVAHHGLGSAFLQVDRVAQAEWHFAEALRIKPRWAGAHVGLADALAQKGDLDAALARYAQALRIDPRHARGRTQYAKALADAGRHDEAVHQYRRVLRAGGGASRTHALLARSLEAQGSGETAIAHYRRAVALEPDFAEAQAGLGAALIRAGRLDEAEQALSRALALDLDSAEIHLALAEISRRLDRPQAAVHHYREALRLDPHSMSAANNLGWLLATHASARVRDPGEAVRIASDFARAAGRDEPALLDTLAAGYAATGRFEDAVATAARAAELAAARGEEGLAREIRTRLILYAAGRPYVEPSRVLEGGDPDVPGGKPE